MSVQPASQRKEICILFEETFGAMPAVWGAFGFFPNAYSSRFGSPSWSKSVVRVVNPVAMSPAVNLLACHVAYGEIMVSVKFAVEDRLSLPATWIVKLAGPADVGLPLITPPGLNVS